MCMEDLYRFHKLVSCSDNVSLFSFREIEAILAYKARLEGQENR